MRRERYLPILCLMVSVAAALCIMGRNPGIPDLIVFGTIGLFWYAIEVSPKSMFPEYESAVESPPIMARASRLPSHFDVIESVRFADGNSTSGEFEFVNVENTVTYPPSDRESADQDILEESGRGDDYKLYRLLFERSLDGLCLMDSEGKAMLVNPALAEMLGYQPEELVGSDFRDFVHPEDISTALEAFQLCRERGRLLNPHKVRFKRRDGKPLFMEIYGNTATFNGKEAIVAHARDVTPQLEMEQQLQQSQRLGNLGVLASGIAHEFNNLLVGIVGYVSFLKMRTLESELERHISVIEDSAQKAANLSRQLLTFGRPYIKDTRVFEVRDLIEAVTTLLSGTFPKKISIKTDIARGGMYLNADLNQLHQVLMNLCINAKDAMPEGGEITILAETTKLDRPRAKRLDDCAPGNYVVISVIDDGTGMDDETRKRIFDPFFTTKEVGKGSGLGLSTVYGIVRGHHGSITVASTPGEGARFDVYLPAATKEQMEAQSNMPAESEVVKRNSEDGSSVTILVTDDEMRVREFLTECLDYLGYSTLIASSGKEAIEVFSRNREKISLVITDMAMPEMNGVELAHKLHDIDPNVRLILSSGFDTGHIQPDIPPQVVDFIQKPYKVPELSEALEKALHQAART